MTLLNGLSRFSFTLVSPTGREFRPRETSHKTREYLSRGGAHSTRNNNSITDRLFQSKETGGISLHSRRRNARRESSSAICTWGRFIHYAPPTWRYAKEFPLHFFNVPTVERTAPSLFPFFPLILFSYIFVFLSIFILYAAVLLTRYTNELLQALHGYKF